MMAAKLRRPKRPNMRRAVILFPSGLTLGNLFFGVFAIITASRGDFRMAGVWVLWGGICDALDGRVARATNAGSQFGEELDSLVDAISFGLAPAMIMYFAVLNRDGLGLDLRLPVRRVRRDAARAVQHRAGGHGEDVFPGLAQSGRRHHARVVLLVQPVVAVQLRRHRQSAVAGMLRFLMAALAFLMISNVPYPVFPRTGFRSLRALGGLILVVGSLVLLATKKFEYFFPLTLIYVAWGLVPLGVLRPLRAPPADDSLRSVGR